MLWFAAGASISLYTGRLTFALGVPIALAALFAAQRGHRLAAIGFAALCPLASPVAALFLACGALGYAVAERRRQGLEIAAAAAVTALAMSLAFPEGGTEPFDFSSFQPAILVAVAVFVALPREEKLLRYSVAVYAAVLAAAFLINSPMGGNATRMGSLLLGPALAFGLWRRQRFALILLVPVLVYWQWSPVVRDLEDVHAQPSVEAGYYAPVRDFLRGTPNHNAYRVEVLPAEHHWESAYVPRGIYIARGWERQLDRKLNPLFYDDVLTASEYRGWLDGLGVGFIAVPDAPLDYAAESEAELISRGLPYLEKAFTSADWTVYRVRDPAPLGGRRRRPGEADPGGLRGRRGRSRYRAGQSALDAVLVDRAGDGLRGAVARRLHHPRCHRAGALPGRRRLLPAAGAGRRSSLRRSPDRDDRAGADCRLPEAGGPAPGEQALSFSQLRQRFLPRGPLDLIVQLAVIAAAYYAWRYARGAVDGSMTASFAHARDLVDVERSLGTLIEPGVQDWAVSSGWPAEVARWGYANLHFKGSCLALAAIYFIFRGSYGFVRNMVLAAMAISVVGYALYPTAPPRFLPELGLDPSSAVTGNQPLSLVAGRPPVQPVRGGPLDARGAVADSLLVARPAGSPPGAEGAALRLSIADDLRRGGQRQPLLARRGLRRGHRRGGRRSGGPARAPPPGLGVPAGPGAAARRRSKTVRAGARGRGRVRMGAR